MDGRGGFRSRLLDAFFLAGACLSLASTVTIAITVPSFGQQDEAAALNQKAGELFRAGKFSEAIPLASDRWRSARRRSAPRKRCDVPC